MTISLCSARVLYLLYNTERGLRIITIFYNFLVGACPPTHIGSNRAAKDHYFYMKTIIFYTNFCQNASLILTYFSKFPREAN